MGDTLIGALTVIGVGLMVVSAAALVLILSLRQTVQQLQQRVARLEALPRPSDPQPGPVPLAAEPPPALPPPLPSHAAPVAPSSRTASEWETLVGVSWLNRIGALVLVVGLALFLGYSIANLGPAGKVSVGFLVGVSLLISGLVLQKRLHYRNFAVSLIGGGWAAIYFTAYAMYAVEGARLITDPVAAALLLLVVSAAMVLHSLQSRSQTATSLAYAIGFVSLHVAPLTRFSVIATAVLAASAVFVAGAFAWPRLAAVSVLFTYGTFAVRYDRVMFGPGGTINGQLTLWIYWILYETFDLLQLRAKRAIHRSGRWIFLFNLLGFIGASALHEEAIKTSAWAVFFAAAAFAYAVSAFCRAQLVSASDSDGLVYGGYQGASAASAFLFAAAIIDRLTGVAISTALLIEGEALIIAGILLKERFFRRLGSVVLLLFLAHVCFVDAGRGEVFRIGQASIKHLTPLTIVAAACFLFHRWIGGMHFLFPHGAALLMAVFSFAELDRKWITVALGLQAALLFAGGLWFRDFPSRIAALLVLILCLGKLFFYDLSSLDTPSRILSFVLLGLLMLAASWLYTRYRSRFTSKPQA